jgi:hypothetical protein
MSAVAWCLLLRRRGRRPSPAGRLIGLSLPSPRSGPALCWPSRPRPTLPCLLPTSSCRVPASLPSPPLPLVDHCKLPSRARLTSRRWPPSDTTPTTTRISASSPRPATARTSCASAGSSDTRRPRTASPASRRVSRLASRSRRFRARLLIPPSRSHRRPSVGARQSSNTSSKPCSKATLQSPSPPPTTRASSRPTRVCAGKAPLLLGLRCLSWLRANLRLAPDMC